MACGQAELKHQRDMAYDQLDQAQKALEACQKDESNKIVHTLYFSLK